VSFPKRQRSSRSEGHLLGGGGNEVGPARVVVVSPIQSGPGAELARDRVAWSSGRSRDGCRGGRPVRWHQLPPPVIPSCMASCWPGFRSSAPMDLPTSCLASAASQCPCLDLHALDLSRRLWTRPQEKSYEASGWSSSLAPRLSPAIAASASETTPATAPGRSLARARRSLRHEGFVLATPPVFGWGVDRGIPLPYPVLVSAAHIPSLIRR